MMNSNRRVNNGLHLFGNELMIPSMFGGMNNLMNSFTMMQNSTAPMHSFSSTTVMSYNGEDGRPKVYQETTSRNRGPNGMEQTRQAIRDTERGINKVRRISILQRHPWMKFQVQIGHRIGDRKHIIEREMNVQTGQISENIELENLDETETDDFKTEWRERSSRSGIHQPTQINSHLPQIHPFRPQLAIEHHSTRRRTPKPSQFHHSDTIDLTGDDTDDIPQASVSLKRKSSHDDSTSRKRRHE